MQSDRTSVALPRDAALDLRRLSLDLSRRERRHVPLGEVIQRLIGVWDERHPRPGSTDRDSGVMTGGSSHPRS
jgi:hypothetical protein